MSNIVCNGKKKTNKSSAGRKPRKPNYDANAILQEQMDAAVHLYNSDMSLQAIADVLVDDYGGDIPLWEKIMDRQGSVCCAWEKTAFEEGMKVGMRLMLEALGI